MNAHMKPIVVTILIFCIAPVLSGEQVQFSKTALAAFAHGARIKVAFHVCDSTGKPVEEALVDIGLSQEANGKIRDYSGKTDQNGNWVLETKCSSIANARIRKNGYYETRIRKKLFSVDRSEVNNRINANGWQPWEQTIILKERRSPSAMCVVESKVLHMPLDKPVGFDFCVGDLTGPLGKGAVADITLQIISTTHPSSSTRSADRLQIVANTEAGGTIKLKQDIDSQMKSVYRAPTNGFMQVATFFRNRDYTGSGLMYDMAMDEGDYIVFRVRVEKDDSGSIVKSKYGKLYKLKFGDRGKDGQNAYVLLSYYLNPTDNDTNLEWDGTDLNSGRKYDIDKILAPL